MMLTLSRVLAVAIVAGDGAQRELRKKGTTHENVTRSSSSQYEHTVNSTRGIDRQSRPYGNVVFLLTSGRSGSSVLGDLISTLTECHQGNELLGNNDKTMTDKPIDVIKGFIHHFRSGKYRYHPHKVLCFKWKAYRDTPEYREAWRWAASNNMVAIYNTRNILDRLVSNDKMHLAKTNYACKLGDKNCVERNKRAVHIKTEGLLDYLRAASKVNDRYEQHMIDAYGKDGDNGYIRVKYDELMYEPTLAQRLKGLQKFADAIWSKLSIEARTALSRGVRREDFVSKTHTETHDYAQWEAISNYDEVFKMLRNTTWKGLLHGSTVVPLNASLSLAEAKRKSAVLEPLF